MQFFFVQSVLVAMAVLLLAVQAKVVYVNHVVTVTQNVEGAVPRVTVTVAAPQAAMVTITEVVRVTAELPPAGEAVYSAPPKALRQRQVA